MELLEAMRTVGACRYYRPDPVPHDVLYAALDAARFAPQGGNRQPVRWIVVEDPRKKARLRDLYLEVWNPYVARVNEGSQRTGGGNSMMSSADDFAQHLHEVPAIVVVCARMEDLFVSDGRLDRMPLVAGASIYPAVQNLCLALRDLGVGSALTTLLAAFEPEVVELLGIPEGYGTAAHIAIGYPARPFPRRLRRMSVEDTTYLDRFGTPFATAPAAPAGG